MISKKEILHKLKVLKPELNRKYAVNKIGIFGSFSDGSYTDKSDIDILVEFNRPIGWDFFTLEKYFEEIFERKIDMVSKNALKPQLRDSILKTVIYA